MVEKPAELFQLHFRPNVGLSFDRLAGVVQIPDHRNALSYVEQAAWKRNYLRPGLHSVQTCAEVHFLQFSPHLRHMLESGTEIAVTDFKTLFFFFITVTKSQSNEIIKGKNITS